MKEEDKRNNKYNIFIGILESNHSKVMKRHKSLKHGKSR